MPGRRPSQLLDTAAERSRLTFRARVERLRATWLTLVQAAVATGLAWLIASELAGHEMPFFAPVAAIITLGVTFGQRGRRGLELAFGVAIGIGIADLLVLAIGSGTWQLVLVTLLAMSTAVVLGGGPIFVTQAAVSAVLVVTLQPPGDNFSFERLVDAAIGASTAMILSYLVLPTDPVALVRRAAEPVLRELAAVLDDVAAALDARDVDLAADATIRASHIDTYVTGFAEALDAGRETAAAALPRRGSRGQVELYAEASGQLELAVRNVRVLARGAIRAVELGDNVPPQVAIALRDLAEAVRGLGALLAAPDADADVEGPAVAAAARATAVLEETANLSVSVIIGQVRSTAVDLLRATGMTREEARTLVRSASGSYPSQPE